MNFLKKFPIFLPVSFFRHSYIQLRLCINGLYQKQAQRVTSLSEREVSKRETAGVVRNIIKMRTKFSRVNGKKELSNTPYLPMNIKYFNMLNAW